MVKNKKKKPRVFFILFQQHDAAELQVFFFIIIIITIRDKHVRADAAHEKALRIYAAVSSCGAGHASGFLAPR